MNYIVYKDIEILGREKSFLKTAKIRKVSQPTLSHRIVREERKQGIELFDRKVRQLTKAGHLYCEYGRKIEIMAIPFVKQFILEKDEGMLVGQQSLVEKIIDFRAFSYVTTITGTGSLTHAAEKLYISQPALTQYLNKLEEKLGFALFVRNRGNYLLTEQGEAYNRYAGDLLEIQNELERKLELLLRRTEKKLAIAINRQTGSIFISKVLPRFHREYPDVRIEIIEADTDLARELLLAQKIDLAVMCVPTLHSGMLRYTLLYKEEMVLIMPEEKTGELAAQICLPGEKPDKPESQVRLADVKDEAFIMYRKYTNFQHMIERIQHKYQIYPEILFEINHFQAVANLVSEGAGLAFFPGSLARSGMAKMKVCSLIPPEYYYVVYALHENMKPGPPLVRLTELMKETATP